MDKQHSIGATLFTSSHPDIFKRKNKIVFLNSFIMLVFGGVILYSSFQLDEKLIAINMILMLVGTSLLLTGIFRLFWRSKELIYVPTMSRVKESFLLFDSTFSDKIVKVLHSADFSSDLAVKSSVKGTVRLDILMSEDEQFVALQLFQSISNTNLPMTPVFYFTKEDARGASRYLRASRENRNINLR